MAKAIMIVGTASDVGKSVIAAGLCRIFYRLGIRVAPFKAQNMSLNSYVTPDGREIGWAQAAQAKACGIEPTADVNPILLKPVSGLGSQVILQGKVHGNMGVRDYYAFKKQVWEKVKESYQRLAEEFSLIVLEGAGGAAEINLRDHDIANFRMAELADASVLLVGDIERGGVFASLVGTFDLLSSQERSRIKGLIINKFRGDATLLKNGLEFLERRTGIPVLGVIPYYDRISIPEEDSVALERKMREQRSFGADSVNIAVIRLPHMANYTDFAGLEKEKGVVLRYLTRRESLSNVDVLILPGTKNTLGDLKWLWEEGWREEILSYVRQGGRAVGICGGYQILGEEVADPLGIEGKRGKGRGLGLLPMRTELAAEKTTDKVVARSLLNGVVRGVEGYEIHMGKSEAVKEVKPAFKILERDGRSVRETDGAVVEGGRIWGSYLHGLFANSSFRQAWLNDLFRVKGLRPSPLKRENKDPYDEWAKYLWKHLNMARVFALPGVKKPKKYPWPGKHS